MDVIPHPRLDRVWPFGNRPCEVNRAQPGRAHAVPHPAADPAQHSRQA